jgi:hypothetical protein
VERGFSDSLNGESERFPLPLFPAFSGLENEFRDSRWATGEYRAGSDFVCM